MQRLLVWIIPYHFFSSSKQSSLVPPDKLRKISGAFTLYVLSMVWLVNQNQHGLRADIAETIESLSGFENNNGSVQIDDWSVQIYRDNQNPWKSLKSPQSSKFVRQSNSGHNFDGVIISEFVNFSSQKMKSGKEGTENRIFCITAIWWGHTTTLIYSARFSSPDRLRNRTGKVVWSYNC